EERIIFLGVQIDDASADDVMAQLLCLEQMDPDRDISIYINSPGGSFTALTAIYDCMQFIRPEIMTVCLGQAASAAAVPLGAGTPPFPAPPSPLSGSARPQPCLDLRLRPAPSGRSEGCFKGAMSGWRDTVVRGQRHGAVGPRLCLCEQQSSIWQRRTSGTHR